MARVHHRKARKDYPAHGIKRGDMYYFAQIKTGPRSSRTIRSLTRPTRSQLTSSDFMSQSYDLDDAVSAADDVETLRSLADDIRQLGEDQQEKLDNMPEGLQQGDTGQLIQERIDGCEEWATSVDEACDEWDNYSEDDDLSDEENADAQREAFDQARENISCPF
jgi:hypothetical protein